MNQIKFKSDILNVKLSKDLSAKYCQENKERQQKKLPIFQKDIKIFLKKKKKKSKNIVVNITKVSQKMKNKGLLSIENNIIQNEKKCFILIIRKCFNLENFASL